MNTSDTRFVAYYRVSTEKQGRSGLGLDAQKSAVAAFMASRTGSRIAAEFTEVESGKRTDRPVLAKALTHAKALGCSLLIAKIDRLSRNAAFLLDLQNRGVPFVAADMPDANEMTVGIMAVIAQGEAKAISKRTREALAEARKRGVKLGNPNGAAAIKHLGNTTGGAEGARRKADAFAQQVAPVIHRLLAEGVTLPSRIATALHREGARTSRGGQWTTQGVMNIMARMNATAPQDATA